MDIMIFLGVLLSLGGVLGGQAIEGGKISSLIQPTAFLIVYFGALGATVVQFSLAQFKYGVGLVLGVLKQPPDHGIEYINKIVEYGTIVRKEGILAMEKKMTEVHDPFFKKGLQLLLDGTEPRILREMLETDVMMHEEYSEVGPKICDAYGGYLPTFGIIGAVLGLISVMQHLDDPESIGSGIAVAFVATVYGLIGANLVCLPLGNKLKMRAKEHGAVCFMIIEGLMSIAAGENPRLTKEKLEGFLTPANKAKLPKE
ncbi:MAG: flagellar motor protein [Nitrospirae bacterium]|nr:flagellar motor protein [Candidatus Troglogloeales bacterium]MBI3597957.1 flagellar motor protein [Candidatus Troglogloeales bacterium]